MDATIPDVDGIFAEACRLAGIERYDLSAEDLVRAIEESVKRYAPAADGRELRKFILSLRLEDLALATACARGSGRAWEEFYKKYHQYLIDTAGEYDLADQVIAELYGMDGQGKIGNFRGRSTLKTWLHALVHQAQVDRHRREARLVGFDSLPAEPAKQEHPESFEGRDAAAALARVLRREIAKLEAPQRLLLAWYYSDGLRLAQIARMRGAHESTVSRELEGIRKRLRKQVLQRLQDEGFSRARIEESFRHLAEAPVDFDGIMDKARNTR
ncbi:MAG TPA: sigma-70 family RNA polymerase sigma factor [Bryobacterales bacterium]|jgi:RNA polymerase sigma factor (sigma-70 family)|nr:sigma-70 family RNA polymerase sigma factor [Bryobacterales bacterium]